MHSLGTGGGQRVEVELKLALDPAATRALRAHPLLAHYRRGPPRRHRLINQYHDTPGADLWRQRMDLRLRSDGRRHVQTLKLAESAQGGLHRRREWELPLARPALDLAALCAALPMHEAAAARALNEAQAHREFGVQVTTRFERTVWRLRSAAGDEVELALDEGEIVAATHRLPLCEVEMELLAGRESALFELAVALQKALPLRPELRGKAERGFALLRAEPPAPARQAKAVPLARAVALPEAVRRLVEECLAQVQANEAGVMRSDEAEYVHQMRVGLRRLRSVLGLVKRAAGVPPALRAELRWIAGELGRARDAEVLALETLPRVPPPTGEVAARVGEDSAPEWTTGWAALREAALAAARAARSEAVRAVKSPRHVAWQLALMQWATAVSPAIAPAISPTTSRAGASAAIDDGQALANAGAAKAPSLARFAKSKLRRLRDEVLNEAQPLQAGRGDAQQYHDLRIAVKRLRYATEMLGVGPPPASDRRRIKALATVQQQLGLLNDAQMAAEGLARLAAARADAPALNLALAAAAAYARGWLLADAARCMRKARKLWLVSERNV